MSGVAPVVLLDEVVAHLDPARRAALYAELDIARRADLDDGRRCSSL